MDENITLNLDDQNVKKDEQDLSLAFQPEEKAPKEKISIREQLNEAKRTVQQQLKSGKHISNDGHSR